MRSLFVHTALYTTALLASVCPARSALTLKPEATARGFSLSLFADGWVGVSIGPLGITFPQSGGVMVSDFQANVRVFPTNSDGQHANLITPQRYTYTTGDLDTIGVRIFLGVPFGGSGVVELNPDGTFKQNIVSTPGSVFGLRANPRNGHLLASMNGIIDIDPVAKTYTQLVVGAFDGLSINLDGSIVYGAGSGIVFGYDTRTGAQVFKSAGISGGIDGTAVGTGVLDGKLYVNCNDGTLVEIDLATNSQTLIASGGSRGDFVKVSPDGTLLITQSDSIYRLRPPPGGSFVDTSTLIYNLTARFKDSSVDLAWFAPGASSANTPSPLSPTGYNVYRRTEQTAATRIATGVTAANFTDTGLTNGTTYYYTVRWTNQAGTESPDSTEMSATPTSQADRSSGKTPPTILSAPSLDATAGQPYTYSVRASDPDPGDSLTFSLPTAPSGMAIDPATGGLQWTPSGTQTGAIPVRIRVIDKLGHFASQAYNLFVRAAVTLRDPSITSSPVTTANVGQLYLYQVVATDPNAGGTLKYSLPTAPSGMTVDAASGLIRWTPALAGAQTVVVKALDQFGVSAQQSFVITVTNVLPPLITSSPVTTAAVNAAYRYAVTANDPNGLKLRYELPQAPAGMLIDAASGLIQWTPSASQAGNNAVTLRVVNAAALDAVQTFTISVIVTPNRPPVITSTAPTAATVGQQYKYQVTATDPDSDPLAFSFVSAPVGSIIDPATGLMTWTPSSGDTGDWNITIRVQDPGRLVATQQFKVSVARAYPVPAISITSPAPGASFSKPIDIIASISDPSTGNPPIGWTVDFQRADGKDTQRIGSGSGAVNGLTIGRIDPTLIRDDSYSVVITLSKAGQVDTRAFNYSVYSGNLKLGNFITSFNDISIPVAGIPLVITRRYDSLDISAGEFGAGWRLALPGAVVDSARETPFEPFTTSTRVYVTRPDGKRVGFTFDPIPPPFFGLFWRPRFRPDPGVTDTLEAPDTVLSSTAGGFVETLGGPYNPSQYTLTTKQGVKYLIDEVAGLQRITDRNGNTLDVTPAGLKSNTGLALPFDLDSDGRITRITEPGGNSVRYAYANANLVSSFDQLGNETKYFYDDSRFPHYLTRIQDPLGRPVTRNVYNVEGRLIAQCDANGSVATLDKCVTFSADTSLRVQTTVNARGFKTELLMDERGNILTEKRYTDSFNHLDTVRTYDGNNNVLTTKDPAGNVITQTYDSQGNVLTRADSGGHKQSHTYVAKCNLPATKTDSGGNTTSYSYDQNCNLRFVTNPIGAVTEYQYNSVGQRYKFIDSIGSTWTLQFDANGFPTARTDPFGKTTEYQFSGAGDLQWRSDRLGRRIDFTYDNTHNLQKESWADGHVITFAYDAASELKTAVDANSLLSFTYDPLGRVQNAAVADGTGVITLTYAYDVDGNVVTTQDSLGGTTSYAYDALDRLSSVQQFGTNVQPKRVDMHYDDASLLQSLLRFADLGRTSAVANTTFGYDCGGCSSRLTSIIHQRASDNSPIDARNWALDAAGNIQHLTDADGSHTYSYDVSQRLLTANHVSSSRQPNEFYVYDPAGNRLSSHLSSHYSYSYNTAGAGNRLVSNDQFTFQYDDEGNLISQTSRVDGTITTYTYDFRNRLTAVSVSNSQGAVTDSEQLTYDPFDRRIRLSRAGQVQTYIWDDSNPILKLSENSSVISRRLYSLSIDGILADEASSQTRWFFTDQVGSVNTVSLNSGQTAQHYVYDSFGQVLNKSSQSGENDLLFTGREFDLLGLGFLRARYFRPDLGRFMSEDPLEPLGYSYANENPLIFADQLGLAAEYVEQHHLVPQRAQATAVAAARVKLWLGSIHNIRNLLPVAYSVHRVLHTNFYYELVSAYITEHTSDAQLEEILDMLRSYISWLSN